MFTMEIFCLCERVVLGILYARNDVFDRYMVRSRLQLVQRLWKTCKLEKVHRR